MKQRLLGAVMLCALTLMIPFEMGCSQQTGVNVATQIVNWAPTIQNAVTTINATASLLLPADATIFAAATVGFDAAATLVVQYSRAYLANPSASVLANLQTAITTLEQNVNVALLQASGIKDLNSQRLAMAAINGLATIVSTLLALIQSISTKAQVAAMSRHISVTLAQVRPLMDQKALAAAGAPYNVTPDQFFAAEAQAGF